MTVQLQMEVPRLTFKIEKSAKFSILVEDSGGRRPATYAEIDLWSSVEALKARVLSLEILLAAAQNEARAAEESLAKVVQQREALRKELIALKQSLAQPAQAAVQEGWEGYNGAFKQAAKALRYVVKHGSPALGGEQNYNSMHCDQIADEIERSIKMLNAAPDRGEVP